MAKLLIFEFRCESCGHKFDDLVKSDVRHLACPQCEGQASRLVSAPHFDPRMGTDGDFSTFSDKWAKTRRDRADYEAKREKEHGVSGAYSDAGASVRH